jgi:hypothetical protein
MDVDVTMNAIWVHQINFNNPTTNKEFVYHCEKRGVQFLRLATSMHSQRVKVSSIKVVR